MTHLYSMSTNLSWCGIELPESEHRYIEESEVDCEKCLSLSVSRKEPAWLTNTAKQRLFDYRNALIQFYEFEFNNEYEANVDRSFNRLVEFISALEIKCHRLKNYSENTGIIEVE